MCIRVHRTYVTKRDWIGYKVVRRCSAGVFISSIPREFRVRQTGYPTTGTQLTYRVGYTTRAPKNSPGIYVYRERPYSSSASVIKVLIPAGTRIKASRLRTYVAERVKVLGTA